MKKNIRFYSMYSAFVSTIIILFGLLLAVGCGEEAPLAPERSELKSAPVDDGYAALEAEMEALEAGLKAGLSALAKQGNVVEVPAGSNDALADALAQAGPGGTVLLRSGLHTESGTVKIEQRVKIVGESGAVLEVNTGSWPDQRAYVEPALHVLNTSKVVIWGVEIRPKTDPGGVAILVENSPHTVIGKTGLYNHQFGIIVQGGDHTWIWKNTVVTTDSRWPDTFTPIGIVVSVGGHVKVARNDVSNAFSGIFASDEKGHMWGNQSYGNAFAGVILCNFTPIPGPGTTTIQAEFSATRWKISKNNAHNNTVGYLVLDGANRNLLANNAASNNAPLNDIELFGDIGLPTSFENYVVAGRYKDITIKDCGVDNKVHGGIQVPCL